MSAKLRRVVVCLDVDHGRVKKGVQFESLRDVGDPVELAARYEAEGADEIVLLDVSASVEGRATLLDVVRRTAERLFIPLTVGGGVRTVDDFERALRAGADKVGINSAAVADPELMSRAAERFGAQCVVLSIDAKKQDPSAFPSGYGVVTHGGRRRTELDAIAWAKRGVALGAGEILLTSIDRDGVRGGYDLELTRAVVSAVTVPVVASGGAGNASHVVDALGSAGADAALVAGILHDGETTVRAIKDAVTRAGIAVRA
ncbi:imidazole glycerol phosphate synthase subunit HisF [Pendulispora albinea]|uniref:Imidazole glycerol phosphate synthase subunit HisF n=1 Tax=Pendulispora albinea TaxID=2741071 RepID=A0ABZ2M6C1_9BACT